MFLFFGLIPSIPDIMYNKKLFPGTRHMITLHLEGTQNGMMLIILALLIPFLNLSGLTKIIYEISANAGAWFNVLPWFVGGLTGAVLKMAEGQLVGNLGAVPPENNTGITNLMTTMLVVCTIGDLVAWFIVFVALIQLALSEARKNEVESSKEK